MQSFFFPLKQFTKMYQQGVLQSAWFYMKMVFVFLEIHFIIIVLPNKCSLVLLFDYVVDNISYDWVLLTEQVEDTWCLSNLLKFMVNTWLFVLAILIGIAKRNLQLAWIALLDFTQEVKWDPLGVLVRDSCNKQKALFLSMSSQP